MMKPFTFKALVLGLLVSTGAYAQPKLNSLPLSGYVIFIDTDGQTVNSPNWNGGVPLVCAAPGLTNAQITDIFNRVSEDYRPFDINITTDSTVYFAAAATQRMRVIVTPTSAWKPGVGGIAWTGSFVWGDDTPCFVFSDRLGPNDAKMIAECCSHESGHTVGLSHQSRYDNNCIRTEVYHSGTGTGEAAWAPVMGNSYYRNMSGWNDGPTNVNCNNLQDNLSIITSQNGFTYRTDDYDETLNGSTTAINATSFTTNGIITTTLDKDAFRFTLSSSSSMHIEVKPYSLNATNNDGANLDAKLMLYNSAQTLLRTYDPQEKMSIMIDTTLLAGTYYLVVDGSGNANTSDYGSLGSYVLTGYSGTLPIRDIALTGSNDKGKHNLSWRVVADEPIRSQTIEASADGINFRAVTTVAGNATKFSYTPYDRTDLYYRVKAVSVIDQTAYSNVINLKAIAKNEQAFNVSTLVNSEVSINASENYQYRLSDGNGKLVVQGNGLRGVNKIDVQNKPSGLYVIQIVSNNHKYTERIIKQ